MAQGCKCSHDTPTLLEAQALDNVAGDYRRKFWDSVKGPKSVGYK